MVFSDHGLIAAVVLNEADNEVPGYRCSMLARYHHSTVPLYHATIRACLLAFIYYFLVVLGSMLEIFRVLGP